MTMINCKYYLELNWTKNFVIYGIDAYAAAADNDNRETTFKITNTNLYVSIVAFSAKGNVKLTKQLSKGFKRPVYWNKYKTKKESKNLDNNNLTRFYLDASFQGVKRLFVLAFNNTTVNVSGNPINNTNNRIDRNSDRKYFLPKVNITNYNAETFITNELMIKLKS